jgi:DNA-directed RNA polymerase subunit RPC12/RpoP
MSRRTFWDEPRATVFRCTECGEKVANPDELGPQSRCPRCNEDLRCCRNCSSFDTSAEKECRQPIPERIPRKRANNDCAWFRPVMAVDLKGTVSEGTVDDARRALDDLFNEPE